MVTNETLPPMEPEPQQNPLDQCSTSASNDSEAHVHARMDQLQNQLNQVILMMQNAQGDTSGMTQHMAGILSFNPHISVPTKITGIHSFNSIAKIYSFIASNISKTSFIWIIDSGATDHICISLGLMHNITKLTTPITIYFQMDTQHKCIMLDQYTLHQHLPSMKFSTSLPSPTTLSPSAGFYTKHCLQSLSLMTDLSFSAMMGEVLMAFFMVDSTCYHQPRLQWNPLQPFYPVLVAHNSGTTGLATHNFKQLSKSKTFQFLLLI